MQLSVKYTRHWASCQYVIPCFRCALFHNRPQDSICTPRDTFLIILYRGRLPRPRFKLRSSSKAYPIFEEMQIDLRVACPCIYRGDAPTRTHTYSHVTATMFPLTLGSGCIQSRLKCRFLIAWKPVCTVHRGRYISWRTPPLHCFILHSRRIVVRSCCMHAPARSYFPSRVRKWEETLAKIALHIFTDEIRDNVIRMDYARQKCNSTYRVRHHLVVCVSNNLLFKYFITHILANISIFCFAGY